MSKITVLAGGTSNEREVSLRSGKSVAEALRTKGYDVTQMDPKDGLDGLGKAVVVFPALHGNGGEDGVIQAALKTRGLPYVGSDVAASALCWDKWLYRQVLQAAGLPVANGELVTSNTIWHSPLAHKPFVLKPVQGGSTLDTHIVRDLANTDKSLLEQVLKRYGVMLMEELIAGTELTLALLGERNLPAIEIIPPEGGEFDYENKYNGRTQELCPPENVSTEIQKQAQELAARVHELTGARDLSRTDIMINEANELFILETNTMPGLTDQSLYPKAAKAAGIDFPDLCDKLIEMALARA